MMDCIDAITSRRSIRRFTDDSVSETDVERLLRAAMSAPSAFNERSARFVVVTDPEVRRRLSETHRYSGMLADAPLAFVVCGDRSAERFTGFYWMQDCAAALTNLLNGAHGIGLGACWVGVQPWPDRAKHVREVVGLPLEIEPFAMVAVGRPAEERPAPDRLDLSFVHHERWGG